MCGVAGFLNRNGQAVSEPVLAKMAEAVAHRGPDDGGIWSQGFVGLAHRRLSVLDLSNLGRQPMQTTDGRFTITYNGEIYNFKELRIELEKLGWQFRSRGDTEVLLSAFAQWGVRSVLKLNGMFAFAVWDAKERCLTLVRDRFGVKPIYYAEREGVFAFASEIKAILAHPVMQPRMNTAAWLEYFTFQNFFTDATPFSDVRILPAGCYLQLTSGGGGTSAVPVRYWDYHFEEPENPRSEHQYLEELDFLFQQAVERQLVSDVEVGGFLSGGVDSGAITAIAARRQTSFRTFTCGFDLSSASGIELSFDERPSAERMSYLFGTEHYEMVLKAGDMQRVLPRLAYHLEEPRVGQSYPNFYAAHLASKFNKVVFAGTGGDELFGGYPWRYYRAVVNESFESYIDKYYGFWQRLIPNSAIQVAFSPVWEEVKHVWTRDIFRDVYATHASSLTRPEDYINHSMYLEAKTFMHGLLIIEDKLSMAHGLETRVPFLDNDLVDFAMKLPARFKLGNLASVVRLNENEPGIKSEKYYRETRDGKLLLRRMMERYVPEDVSNRAKQGFSGPDSSWFKGESIDYVRDVLFDDKARIYEMLNPTVIRPMIEGHLNGNHNRRLLIWSLLNVEQTMRAFF